MDYSILFKKLEEKSTQNKNIFKNINNILYFNEDKYLPNANFLQDNNTKILFDMKNNTQDVIEKKEDTFKKISNKVKMHIDLDKYNLNKKLDNITECILNVINFYDLNCKNIFFKKLLKDYDTFNLYKKYKCKGIRKKELRNFLIKKEEENIHVKQFIVNYLNINLILFTNNDIKIFGKDSQFEIYRPTIIIYFNNGYYYYLSNKNNKKIFTSTDYINLKLKKKEINENIKNYKLTNKKVDFNVLKKMKVKELYAYCNNRNINIKIEKKNKKGFKYMIKKDILNLLK